MLHGKSRNPARRGLKPSHRLNRISSLTCGPGRSADSGPAFGRPSGSGEQPLPSTARKEMLHGSLVTQKRRGLKPSHSLTCGPGRSPVSGPAFGRLFGSGEQPLPSTARKEMLHGSLVT